MNWEREKADWPWSQISRFIKTESCRWHLQRIGSGPKILLLHGSGATTHSFNALIDALQSDFEVMSFDLPGHGFSSELRRKNPSIENVASAIDELLVSEKFDADIIVGHSAGAAIAVEMIIRKLIKPKAFVAINGAFYPFPGFAGSFFPAMAKLLFLNPFVPSLFSVAANKSRVKRLMESTGSNLSANQISYYERALASSAHIRGTLSMMASWQLHTMRQKLSAVSIPTCLVIGNDDGTISPQASLDTEQVMPDCQRTVLQGYGHLVHEEAPEQVAAIIRDFWTQAGISTS